MKIYLPDHGHKDRREWCIRNNVGLLYSPHRNKLPIYGDSFIIDNGAFPAWKRGKVLDLDLFIAFLNKIEKRGCIPDFVVLPDIVGDGGRSLGFSMSNRNIVPGSWRRYLAVQDGMYPAILEDLIPLINGIFVGGTVLWKWRTAETWIRFAHENRIPCHIGRVGTERNYLRAASIGADSVDGSTPMRHRTLEEINAWRARVTEEATLWG